MRLSDLCDTLVALHFPKKAESVHPDEATVRIARAGVTGAVVDDEFLADCLGHELLLIESNRLRQGLTPFFVLPDHGIEFSFGYWAPGATPGPHEHTAWTITAVCRNELDVFTYDRDASYRQKKLVPKNMFHASAGKVGFIYSPCIHAPINNSTEWSLSFHVTSPRDGERPPDCREPIPELDFSLKFEPVARDHPYVEVIKARQRERHVWQIGYTLASMNVPLALELLAKCYGIASMASQRRLRQLEPRLRGKETAPGSLMRVHPDLALSHRFRHDEVSLYAESPTGPRQELVVNGFGREALAFATKEPRFDVRDLPGNLSSEEKSALGEALQDTGLFKRVTE